MLVFLCISILGLYLASVPVPMKIRAGADIESGEVYLSFSIFFIKLLNAKGLIENRNLTEADLLILKHKRKKDKDNIHVKINQKSVLEIIEAIKNINFTLFTNLDVKEIYLKLEYGAGDAFKTMAYLGALRTLFYSLAAALKGNQKVVINEQFIPRYYMRTLKTEIYGIFSLSVADITYGYLLSKLKKMRLRLRKKFPAAG